MAKLNQQLAPEIRKNYVVENETLKRVIKSNPERNIELEIGDATRSDFVPQHKAKWFDNEYNVSYRAQEHPDAIVRTTGNQIRYETPEYTVIQYEKPEMGEDGGFELEWELPSKPQSNILPFTLRYRGDVRFYHQPALTQEEIDEGNERPENVVDSYAVYVDKRNHKKGSNNYANGKIQHIYRPKAIDANGNEVWCKLHIPPNGQAETNIECSVEVPQDFLDSAAYPVLVDPTFGYTSQGASSQYLDDQYGNTYGNSATGLSGTLDSVSAWLRGSTTGSYSETYYVGDGANVGDHNDIFAGSESESLTSSFSEQSITASGQTLTSTSYVSISGNGYPSSASYLAYDAGTGTSGGFYNFQIDGAWDAQDTRNYSIYATYSDLSQTSTHTVNSVLKGSQTSSHTTDALLKEELSSTHTSDSLLKTTPTSGHTADALLKTLSTTTHTIDSLLKELLTAQHTIDSLLKTSPTITHTVDAFLESASTRLDTTNTSVLGNGALGGYAIASAYKFSESAIVFHTADSLLKANDTVTSTIDGLIKKTLTVQHTLDALAKKTSTATYTSDAFLKASPLSTHTLDSFLDDPGAPVIINTSVLGNGALGAYALASAYQLTTSAQTLHTVNGLLKAIETDTHTVDGLMKATVEVAHTVDALLKSTLSATHTIDSFLEKLLPTSVHTVDSYICRPWLNVEREAGSWTNDDRAASSWTNTARSASSWTNDDRTLNC